MNAKSDHPVNGGSARPDRRWAVGLFFAAWTILALAACWWLYHYQPAGAAFVIGRNSGSGQPWGLRLREWFEVLRVNFYWAWGWLLLCPYVGWLGWRFHLERGRLLARGAVLLAAGVGFVWVSRAVTSRAATDREMVVVTSSSSTVEEIKSQDGSVRQVMISLGHGAGGEVIPANTITVTTNFPVSRLVVTNSRALPPEIVEALRQALGSNVFQTSLTVEPPREFPLPASRLQAKGLATASNLTPVLRSTIQMGLPPLRRGNRLPLSAGLDGLAYVGLLGIVHAARFHRRYREREQQAVLLSSQLTHARLHTLQAQLQPHFLFNALNGIATLVRCNPVAAHEMLISLSELLRLALSQSERQQIPLREELAFLDRYIEIQQMRFGDRLHVERQLEPAALDCLVPTLLLQPLVENAIRHGIEPAAQAGVVRLVAACQGGQLWLAVEDNGVGLPVTGAEGVAAVKSGVGLTSVRERLTTLYDSQYQFELKRRPQGGVTVSIRLPLSRSRSGDTTSTPSNA